MRNAAGHGGERCQELAEDQLSSARGRQQQHLERASLPLTADAVGASFIHIDDAAWATAAAIERGAPGIYNVTDDEPAPVATWLPELADAVGARAPWRVPVWLARALIGEAGVAMMTELRGASNAKAKGELDWHPAYASWRDGFRWGLE
jgi:nucleoside-diphosphate-sugar epimerase